MWLAISAKGEYAEFLLSLYSFESATIRGPFGDYEDSLPTLQNEEKVADFSQNHGTELLLKPIEIEL